MRSILTCPNPVLTITVTISLRPYFEYHLQRGVHYIHFISQNRGSEKKHRHIHTHIDSHIQLYKYIHIRTHTNNIYMYTHTTVYVEAIELHDMVDTLFHSLESTNQT